MTNQTIEIKRFKILLEILDELGPTYIAHHNINPNYKNALKKDNKKVEYLEESDFTISASNFSKIRKDPKIASTEKLLIINRIFFDFVSTHYEDLPEVQNLTKDPTNTSESIDFKIEKLVGYWECYAWNENYRTGKNKAQIPLDERYISVYKIEITENKKVNLVTNSKYVGTINWIIDGKFQMNLREIGGAKIRFYIGNLGSISDKKEEEEEVEEGIEGMNLVYVDSGKNDIRCGLVVMLKNENDSFKNMKVENVQFKNVNLPDNLKEYLAGQNNTGTELSCVALSNFSRK